MTTSKQQSKESFFDGRWLRRASDIESYFDDTQQNGLFSLCYKMRLKSKAPLREDNVRSALTHLYRKCPALSVCFGDRGETKWIRRALNPDIDFKVVKDQGMEEVIQYLFNYHFSRETGPLFAARLMENVSDAFDYLDEPEDHSFHTSYILFALYHGIGDGMGYAYVMGFFVKLLNDVISGQPICDDEPLGQMVPSDYLEEEIDKNMELLKSDPVLKAKISQEMEAFEGDVAYIKTSFPTPKGKRETNVQEYVLGKETTAKFLKRCKQEGVTFNSGFSAAVNIAFTDLLLENGIEQDNYTLKTYSLINFRRYSKTDLSCALGVHSGYPLAMTLQVPGKLGSQFWQYARSLHAKMFSYIQSGKCILDYAYTKLSSQDEPIPLLNDNSPTFSDFAISNIGEVTHMVSKGGEEVRPTHYFRLVAMHPILTCGINMQCHTLLGNFMFSVSYNTALVERDVIKRFGDQIVKRMQSVLE